MGIQILQLSDGLLCVFVQIFWVQRYIQYQEDIDVGGFGWYGGI